MDNRKKNICEICGLVTVSKKGDFCVDCQQAIANGEAWAIALAEEYKSTINGERRSANLKADDLLITQDTRQPESDTHVVMDSIAGVMGITFPPGYLDVMEKYDPAIKYIEIILNQKPSERIKWAMVAQMLEMFCNYFAHEPEFAMEQNWHVTPDNFKRFHEVTMKPAYQNELLNKVLIAQGKQAVTYKTFKEYLSTAKQTLKDYERKHKSPQNG